MHRELDKLKARFKRKIASGIVCWESWGKQKGSLSQVSNEVSLFNIDPSVLRISVRSSGSQGE